MEAVVSVRGAEPLSAAGTPPRSRIGVLLLHGFTGSPAATRPLGERLAAVGYCVEVPALPGHGTTVADLATTRYTDWYGAAERVLDYLVEHTERVVVAGLSAGGTLALDLAVRRGEDVAGVVAINALLRDPHPWLAGIVRAVGGLVPAPPRRWLGMPPDDVARTGVVETAYRRVPLAPLRSLLDELPRIRSRIEEITGPLLVVRSTHDHTVDSEDSRALVAGARRADVRELVCERSYHVVTLDHDAGEVGEAVLRLLDELHDGLADDGQPT